MNGDFAFFVVRVTSSQEKITADILQNKVSKTNIPVYAIVIAEGMRGYLILEAESDGAVRELITGEPHIKGMLPTPLSPEELDKMIEIKKYTQEIKVNDIVEFSSGPFKGYKAKVMRVDPAKDEITVELMDVVVPIPVTTKSNLARVVQKAE
ncbi:MAG: transcription elongation factor Spt5 [Candidatus Micrarchaeaceae archaeon]